MFNRILVCIIFNVKSIKVGIDLQVLLDFGYIEDATLYIGFLYS